MVASGLSERVSVSQYRLALHLGLAFVILGALIWTALQLDEDREARPASDRAGSGMLLLGLAFLQVELGALVAGMKAGLAYNTWPLMDGQVVPSGLFIAEPWYINLFENAMTVQFNHRLVAYVLAGFAAWHIAGVMRSPTTTVTARMSALALGAAIGLQIALGIWTLVAQVPLSLGLVHQFGAAILFSIAVWHVHALKTAR
jgi:cytochrome c oxidase assembly protein subunit 15